MNETDKRQQSARVDGVLHVHSRDRPSLQAAFAVLVHLRLLASRAPPIFSGSYKNFFCRYTDPSYIKGAKLAILETIADTSNAFDIVSELSEYVTDVNAGEPELRDGTYDDARHGRCPSAP